MNWKSRNVSQEIQFITRGIIHTNLKITMELIEVITSKENLNKAYKKVVANKGSSGVDGISVEQFGQHIKEKL